MKKRYLCLPVLVLWLGLCAALWLGGTQDISYSERRKLAQFPAFSGQTISQGSFMSGFESFCQDQFPGREAFRTANALFQKYVLGKKDSNGIVLVDGQAMKLEYPLHTDALDANLGKLTAVNRQFLEGAEKIVFTVVPDKAYYLAGSTYPKMDYAALFDRVSGLDFARYVDITDLLHGSDYYRTDLHWNQADILPAANRLCEALGIEAPDGLEETVLGDFYGVYYGQAALPMQADTMTILENDHTRESTVQAYGGKTETAVYDLPLFSGRDAYDVFLSGSSGLLTVTNPLGNPAKKLVVFRDSFGSSLVPLLLQGYGQVELVDIRYLPAAQLGKLVDFEGKDVLFVYSTTVLNTPGIFK